MWKRIAFTGLMTIFLFGCQGKSNREEKIAAIPISFSIERFDKKFTEASPADLPELKTKYPFLFPEKYPDSVWINKMKDSLQQQLNAEVLKKYPDLEDIKTQLHDLFQHLKYYFPNDFDVPRVITLTSNVDYRYSTIVTDSLLLISLDAYLGEDHRFYSGLQRYFAKDFIKAQIVPDVAKKYAERLVTKPQKRTFLAYMIYYGKLRYLMQRLLPDVSEASIMAYTPEELDWAKANEYQIWGYFIEHRIFYKTNPDLRLDFFAIGPYTKFGLVLDSQSPPQLGQYMGLRIIQAYAQNHEKVSLPELLEIKSRTIFEDSDYKPKQN